MTNQAPLLYAPGLADAGAQIAQLYRVRALVGEMAGRDGGPDGDSLEAAARVSAAYQAAPPIDQRRFDNRAREATAAAAAGVEALLALQERGRPCEAAASVLAETLERALHRLVATFYA